MLFLAHHALSVELAAGAERLETKPSDFSTMLLGMCPAQVLSGLPNTRKSIPCAAKWAARERPWGPAPITATSQIFMPISVVPFWDARFKKGQKPRISRHGSLA